MNRYYDIPFLSYTTRSLSSIITFIFLFHWEEVPFLVPLFHYLLTLKFLFATSWASLVAWHSRKLILRSSCKLRI